MLFNSLGKVVDDPTCFYRNRAVDLLFQSVSEYGGKRIIGVRFAG